MAVGCGLKPLLQDAESSWWSKYYEFRDTDILIEPLLNLSKEVNWLKKARDASYLSTREMARRLDLSVQAYHCMERDEARGTISLQNLERCAAVMDCELIYAIRPKSKKRFSHRIARTLLESLKHLYPYKHPTEKIVSWLIHMMHARMYDAEFRRRHGWCRNNTAAARGQMQLREVNRWMRRCPQAYGREF